MPIASTRDMTTGEDRRAPPPALHGTRQPVALVSRADGRILSANTSCERLFGYAAGGLHDRHLSETSAAPARSPEGRAHEIAHDIAATGVWSGETEGMRANGTTLPCIVSLSEIAGGGPGSRRWGGVFTPT